MPGTGSPGGSAAPPLSAEALIRAAHGHDNGLSGVSRSYAPAQPASGAGAGQSAVQPPLVSSTPTLADGVPEEVGASGEYFVLMHLMSRLPNFVRACWVSALKLHYFQAEDATFIENDLGADFRYHDLDGKLSGSGRSELVFIEVKSMTQDGVQPFRMSANEWTRAKQCHESGGREVYVIAVVTAVTRKPKLEFIVDPIAHVERGSSTCEVLELVYSPTPRRPDVHVRM